MVAYSAFGLIENVRNQKTVLCETNHSSPTSAITLENKRSVRNEESSARNYFPSFRSSVVSGCFLRLPEPQTRERRCPFLASGRLLNIFVPRSSNKFHLFCSLHMPLAQFDQQECNGKGLHARFLRMTNRRLLATCYITYILGRQCRLSFSMPIKRMRISSCSSLCMTSKGSFGAVYFSASSSKTKRDYRPQPPHSL